MPYYVHGRGVKADQEHVSRVAMFSKQDAIAVMQDGESVSFIPNTAEHEAWRDREYRRLFVAGADGQKEYQPLPFATPWEHYAHRAKGDPEKVSYTPDATYGHEDRRLVTTPVRYLEKYAEMLNYSRDQFAELAGKMRAGAMALRFAETAEAIARVYCAPGGPTSCMDGSDFDLENTPVRAYAGGDLSVAYLGKLDEDSPSDDRIHARAIVWRERKHYVRVYGDCDAMYAALKSEGYNKVSSWDGARLRAIEADRTHWVVPYIDGGCQRLGHEGNYLVIGAGQIDGTNTSGQSRMVSAHVCERCSDPCDEGESYCDSCNDNHFVCANCGDDEFGDQYTINEDSWCAHCYRGQRNICSHCSTRYNSAEAENGEYCDSCYEYVSRCDRCDSVGHCNDLDIREHGDSGEMCADCRRYISRQRVRPLHLVVHNGVVTLSVSSAWGSLQAWIGRRY